MRSRPSAFSPLEEVKRQIRLKEASTLTAGTAKVEITPAVGTPLAGAARGGKRSVGIRDPLYVRVLALSDGQDTLLLLSGDLLCFPQPLAEQILAKLSQQFQIPRAAIFLAATHTHSGAGAMDREFWDEKVFGFYRSEIAEGFIGRIAWGVGQALSHRRKVRWGVADGVLPGLTENSRVLGGFSDPAVDLFLVESNEGKPMAVLVNAAASPSLLDPQDARMSADFPGTFSEVIETAYPGSVALFMNGADADVKVKDLVGNSAQARLKNFGQALAEIAVGLINQAHPKEEGDLAAWGIPIKLPPAQLRWGWLPLHPRIGALLRPANGFVNLFGLDKNLFVALPASLTGEVGRDLKEKLRAQGFHPFLVGYANGFLGSAVTPSQHRMKAYESWMSWYGPSFGLVLVEQARQLAGLYAERIKK